MEFSREKIKQIKNLMVLAAFLILAVIYSEKLFFGIIFLAGILKPFFYGGAVAFVLNIPMKWIEEKLLGRLKGEKVKKLKRPLSIVLSIMLIALVLAAADGSYRFGDREKNSCVYGTDDAGI